MKILYDSSVLVAVLISGHPKHEICNAFFNQGKSGKHEIIISSHSIAEMFSALTRMPVKPQIHPGSARQMIKENLLRATKIIEFSRADYEKALDLALDYNLIGGIIYDLLIFVAAKKEKVSKIATLNIKHFSRICPEEINFLQTF